MLLLTPDRLGVLRLTRSPFTGSIGVLVPHNRFVTRERVRETSKTITDKKDPEKGKANGFPKNSEHHEGL